MIAHADAPVRAAVALERDPTVATSRTHGFPLSSGGSAIRPSVPIELGRTRSPRPRALETLWVWTCAPTGMSAVATPIGLPYFMTALPDAIGRTATLCPRGIGSRTVTDPTS